MHGRLLVVAAEGPGVSALRRATQPIAPLLIQPNVDVAIALLAAEDDWVGLVLGETVGDAKAASALATFRRRFPDAPALLLTKAPHPAVMHRAFTANTGYVCAPIQRDVARTFATRVMLHTRIAFPAVERRADGLASSFNLTTHEAHIVGLVLRGYDREHLATALGVAENTLKSRIRKLLRKFGVRSLRALLTSVLRNDQDPAVAALRAIVANDSVGPPSSAERAAVGSE